MQSYKPKECTKCGKKFEVRSSRTKWCKACVPNREAQQLMTRYNVSYPEYLKMVKKNKGICTVCKVRKVKVVDHCHYSGKVRGMLCINCNTALWMVEDPGIRERAVNHVNKVMGYGG